MMISSIQVNCPKQGLFEVTNDIQHCIAQTGIQEGLCTLFIQHTSASLLIQENADPSAKRDLENWLNYLVPENHPLYSHTQEGPDDMPAHIKSSLTSCSLSVPIINASLALGTWQGIYVWEHRHHGGNRKVIIHAI